MTAPLPQFPEMRPLLREDGPAFRALLAQQPPQPGGVPGNASVQFSGLVEFSPHFAPRQDISHVLFDFDGTLTHRDSFAPFLLHAFGGRIFATKMLQMALPSLSYLCGKLSRDELKATLISVFLTGVPMAWLEEQASAFCTARWQRLMRPQGVTEVAAQLGQGAHVTLCSASPALMLKPFAVRLGVQLIGTELEVVKITEGQRVSMVPDALPDVTLKGTVNVVFQRNAAFRDVRHLVGVRGVSNLLEVRQPTPAPADVKQRIERALVRNAEVDAKGVRVEVRDHTATLRGIVRSDAERRAAAASAASAPGITEVDNFLLIEE